MDSADKMIRLFGHTRGRGNRGPLALTDVTLVANPDVLRELAAFFNFAAAQIERHGASFGHEHFSDFPDATVNPESGDVIISGPHQ